MTTYYPHPAPPWSPAYPPFSKAPSRLVETLKSRQGGSHFSALDRELRLTRLYENRLSRLTWCRHRAMTYLPGPPITTRFRPRRKRVARQGNHTAFALGENVWRDRVFAYGENPESVSQQVALHSPPCKTHHTHYIYTPL